jgi:hypothetical protein
MRNDGNHCNFQNIAERTPTVFSTARRRARSAGAMGCKSMISRIEIEDTQQNGEERLIIVSCEAIASVP